MALPSYDDERALAKLLDYQKSKAWDFDKDLPWSLGIDSQKPFVALDNKAFFFPDASQEERLAVSQMMGLIIASAISELEDTLLFYRKQGFDDILKAHPVNPEFKALGEQFFVEEEKHSRAFVHYMEKFAQSVGVEYKDLKSMLPVVRGTKTEKRIVDNLNSGGLVFWWVVLNAEQVFLFLYHAMAPHKDVLDPLYLNIHRRHFEEEARHASFPYLMVDYLLERRPGLIQKVHRRKDLAYAQLLQATWSVSALQRTKEVKKMKGKHPFFDILARLEPVLAEQSPIKILYQLLTSTPYVSAFVNPGASKRVVRFGQGHEAFTVPFPDFDHEKLVAY